ncbi:hypothetical protein V1511DRAFT_501640 [Dipodascopsis uninucleata]
MSATQQPVSQAAVATGVTEQPPTTASLLSSAITTTNSNLTRLSKTVAATSMSLSNGGPYGDITSHTQYRSLMKDLVPTLNRPTVQRRLFSLGARSAVSRRGSYTPSTLKGPEFSGLILSKEVLNEIPDSNYAYSLLDGFKATMPESDESGQNHQQLVRSKPKASREKKHDDEPELTGIPRLEKDRKDIIRKLQRLDIRKAIVFQGIQEIDARIELLNNIKQKNFDRLAKFEDQEQALEDELRVLDYRIELLQEEETEAEEGAETPEDSGPVSNSIAIDSGSISLLALGDSMERYSNNSEHSSYTSEKNVVNNSTSQEPVSDDEENDGYDSENDDDSFSQMMSSSMREAWVSSFLEWEKLSE